MASNRNPRIHNSQANDTRVPYADVLLSMAAGRWPEILVDAGMPSEYVDRREGAGGDCPVCSARGEGGDDRFSIQPDFDERGAVLCRKCFNGFTSPHNGDGIASIRWLRGCDEFEAKRWLHNWLLGRGVASPKAATEIEPKQELAKKPVKAWDALQQIAGVHFKKHESEVASALGVSIESLRRLRVGWRAFVSFQDKVTKEWKSDCATVWPMMEAAGKMIGQSYRGTTTGLKRREKGSQNGLTFEPTILERKHVEQLYVSEGQTDCAAALTIGLEAVACPSVGGKAAHEMLLDLVKSIEPQEVVVVADNDADGGGEHSAIELAKMLSKITRAKVILPQGFKDLRAWLKDGGATKETIEQAAADALPFERAPGEESSFSPGASDASTTADDDADDEQSTTSDKPSASLPTFAGIDAAELSNHVNEETDWLVDGLFSSDQPTVFGAASKATKTTQLVDLSVALATGTKWLGCFDVPKPRKVLLITGEANYRAASKRVWRALKARNLGWDALRGNLRVEAIEFPILPSESDRRGIAADVAKHGFDVVIIDPLYRGLQGVDAFRMAEVGGAILEFVKACRPASVIISHHITKHAAREMGTPTLEDLSGAGLAESAGNWWLIGRNSPYAFDGMHDLSVVYGGRDEQAGLLRLVFNESEWTFEASSGQGLKEERAKEAAARKQKEREARIREARAAVQHALSLEKEARPKSWIEERSGHPQGLTRSAIAEMLNDQTLVEATYTDARGRESTGLILATRAEKNKFTLDAR